MMANATRDPLMWAALAIAEQDVPEVGDMCLRCHAPVGWMEGRVTKGSPPPTQGQNLTQSDFEGVTCHLCHRMTTGPNATPYEQNGQIWIADDDVRRGPFNYDPAIFEPPHNWKQSDLFTDAALCGQCHNVTNPLTPMFNSQGQVIASGFPIERTYAEWKASSFSGPSGQTCQDCHMPRTPDARGCTYNAAPLHDELPRHEFAGGNTFIPLVLAGEFPALGRAENFEATRLAALDMLRQKSADLEVMVPGSVVAGKPVSIRVRVTNRTGHKLPTGYTEGRRMWLHVTARAGGAEPILESGKYDEVLADIVPDERIKVYEAVHGIHGKGPSFHFVLNNMIVKDNRIPPLGFVPAIDTAPAGASFEMLPGGTLANWDDTFYVADIPSTVSGMLTVTAELFYQTSSREYVEFLKDANTTNDAGQKMYDLWEAYGNSEPVKMIDAAFSGPIAPCVPEAEACNLKDDDCDGDADEDLGFVTCGIGACASTVPACSAGKTGTCIPHFGTEETCNGVDDDCDGQTDEAACPDAGSGGSGGGPGSGGSGGKGDPAADSGCGCRSAGGDAQGNAVGWLILAIALGSARGRRGRGGR
jgi:MYXO-CTERM domain-containing protein